MSKRLIQHDRSVIVAADVDATSAARRLAGATKAVPLISGFKVGMELGLNGLSGIVRILRDQHLDSVIIYDHQKAGNDIPDMGAKFARKLKECNVDAAILFPFAGPKTQRAWTEACLGEGLHVLVGGVMTHPEFLVSEGGYISDDAPESIFDLACEQGVRDFVVPGNKIDWVKRLRSLLEKKLGAGNFDLYAPGFVTQGGDISECGAAAGPRFHAIVGSAIYGKEKYATHDEMRKAAVQATSKLVA